ASSAADTTAPASSAPAADKSPIVIAALIDQTGPSAGDGPAMVKVVKAWADAVNGKGGINGHPVDMQVADTKGDPAAAQTAIDAMTTKKPLAFLLSTSSTESAMAESLTATGVPVIGMGYSPSVWGGNIEAFKLACSTAPGAAVACAIPN